MPLGRTGAALGMALAAVVAVAAVAWACVPQPLLVVGPVSSAPAGAKATVNGLNFTGAAAEVRWNGLDGPLLGSAAGPDFSLEVTIPDVAAGLYVMVGIVRGRDGSVGETGTASFQVIDKNAPAVSSAPPGAGPEPGGAQENTTRSSEALSWPEVAGVGVGVFVVGAVVGSLARRRRGTAGATSSS